MDGDLYGAGGGDDGLIEFLFILNRAGSRRWLQRLPPAGRIHMRPYCAAIFAAAGANRRSISRRSFTAVRLSSIWTSA